MKVEAVYHRPRNEFAYYDTNGTATILLRVGSNDILRARLFWFDKYCIDESIAAVEMESSATACFLIFASVLHLNTVGSNIILN